MMSRFQGYAAMEKGSKVILWEFEAEPLGPRDVEVEVEFCGLCHTYVRLE